MGQFALVLVAADNSANTSTIYPNTSEVDVVEAPTAGEIVNFPTANAAVLINRLEQNQVRRRRYLTASSVATINAAIAAANAGVLGSGVSGQTTLVAGTKVITIAGLTSSNLALTGMVVPNTITSTVDYKAVCTTNTLTITALVAAGTINAADISTLNYAIVG